MDKETTQTYTKSCWVHCCILPYIICCCCCGGGGGRRRGRRRCCCFRMFWTDKGWVVLPCPASCCPLFMICNFEVQFTVDTRSQPTMHSLSQPLGFTGLVL